MKTRIVRIGNSQGIRLPRVLLNKAKLGNEVELQAEPGRIMISNTTRLRTGWAEAARHMREKGDDSLIGTPVTTRFDKIDWKWR